MHVRFKPQRLLERLALLTGRVPVPLGHSHIFSFIARAVYDAAYFQVFEVIGREPQTPAEAATACSLNEKALRSLLTALAPLGYFNVKNGRFSLTPMARKWLLRDSPSSVFEELVFMREVWHWLAALPDFLQTGRGLDYHAHFNDREWELYQQGMYVTARASAGEVVRKTPLPPRPRKMLDIGGSHGLYSAALCKKYHSLRSVILDLPEAIEKARPLLARQKVEGLVSYQPGNALTFDYGEQQYDLVFISSLLHHFTPEENRALAQKIARALKPGGYFVIQEFIRPQPGRRADAVGSVLDLFFTLSSNAGTWSVADMQDWQTAAGLKVGKMQRFLTMPGFAQISALKM